MLLPAEKNFQDLLSACFKERGSFEISWNNHKSFYESLDQTLTDEFPTIDATTLEDITKNDSLWIISGKPSIASSTLAGALEQIAPVSEPLRQTIDNWEDLIKRINHKEYSSFSMEVESASKQGFEADVLFQVLPSSAISISPASGVWSVASLLDNTRDLAICENVMKPEELDHLPSVVQKRMATVLSHSLVRDNPEVKAWLSKKDLQQHVTPSDLPSTHRKI